MAHPPPVKKHRSSPSSPSHYTLRVELLDSHPTVWRRLHVDGRVRLNALHHLLQAAMGWSDAHLHEFEIREKHCGAPDPDYAELEMRDETKYRLNQLLDVGDTCIYLYDFGDSWRHRITVESIKDIDEANANAGNAWIENGERACPPEDAGGAGGYQEMLDILENAPYSDEANQLREWAGLDFEPGRFDRLAANAAIDRLLWNRWIKIGK